MLQRKEIQHMPTNREGIGLYGQDIISVDQFDRAKLDYVFSVANEMKVMVERFGSADLLQGNILANLFYEPSTRTSSSFMAAMMRLGGQVIPINNVQYSSVTKGESLPDTVRTLESYADVIVIRHPEVGAAATAAHYAKKPVINAGDGIGEHPTQALLDLFTIQEALHKVDGLKVAMVGDLRYSRTVHSLTKLLTNYDIEFMFVSPDILQMPKEILDVLQTNQNNVNHNGSNGIDSTQRQSTGQPFHQLENINEIINDVDVLYVTRVQKERFTDLAAYDRVKDHYIVDEALMNKAKERMIVMHPLPRVNEISYTVDDDPRAAYFRQMRNGMYVRMALLASVLGKV